MRLFSPGRLGTLAVGAVAACGAPPPEAPTAAPGAVEVVVDDRVALVTVGLWVNRQPGDGDRETIRGSLVLASGQGVEVEAVSVTLQRGLASWTGTPALVGERSDVRREYSVDAGPVWGVEAPIDVTVVLTADGVERIVRIAAVRVRVVE